LVQGLAPHGITHLYGTALLPSILCFQIRAACDVLRSCCICFGIPHHVSQLQHLLGLWLACKLAVWHPGGTGPVLVPHGCLQRLLQLSDAAVRSGQLSRQMLVAAVSCIYSPHSTRRRCCCWGRFALIAAGR
jgi:hypothetical protein